MTTVLVTGAGGFLARATLAPLLSRGLRVIGTGRSAPPPWLPRGIEWHPADLLAPGTSRALLQRTRPTHLLHAAWITTPGAYWTAAANTDWSRASLDLLHAFAEHHGRRALFVGTCAQYDWTDTTRPALDEHLSPSAPATLYGRCKHTVETDGGAALSRAGVSFASARMFFLFGPHEHPDRFVPQIIAPLLRGSPAACNAAPLVRDLMHVHDAGEALAALLASPITGPVNVARGEGVALGHVAGLLADIVGRADLLQMPATPASNNQPAHLVAAVNRLRDEVGWRPQADLASRLRETVAWWREHAAEPNTRPGARAERLR